MKRLGGCTLSGEVIELKQSYVSKNKKKQPVHLCICKIGVPLGKMWAEKYTGLTLLHHLGGGW